MRGEGRGAPLLDALPHTRHAHSPDSSLSLQPRLGHSGARVLISRRRVRNGVCTQCVSGAARTTIPSARSAGRAHGARPRARRGECSRARRARTAVPARICPSLMCVTIVLPVAVYHNLNQRTGWTARALERSTRDGRRPASVLGPIHPSRSTTLQVFVRGLTIRQVRILRHRRRRLPKLLPAALTPHSRAAPERRRSAAAAAPRSPPPDPPLLSA